jgi:hypothetical protein
VVAAFASWHDRHGSARRALDAGLRLPEYCALETFSVLTRLPPHRAPAEVARDVLMTRFPEPLLRITPNAYRAFIASLPAREVSGGAAYDAWSPLSRQSTVAS